MTDSDRSLVQAVPVTGARPAAPIARRRLLWCIYALPLTLYLVLGMFLEPAFGVAGVIDIALTIAALVGLQLHIWDKQVPAQWFWKAFAFGYVAWDLGFNLLIVPYLEGAAISTGGLLVGLFHVPFYAALFRYAFRTWAPLGVFRTGARI